MIVYDTFSYKNVTLKIKMLHDFLVREEYNQKIIQMVEALV